MSKRYPSEIKPEQVNEPGKNPNIVHLTAAQKKMLKMSEEDIANGKVISQEELDRQFREWIKDV